MNVYKIQNTNTQQMWKLVYLVYIIHTLFLLITAVTYNYKDKYFSV